MEQDLLLPLNTNLNPSLFLRILTLTIYKYYYLVSNFDPNIYSKIDGINGVGNINNLIQQIIKYISIQ